MIQIDRPLISLLNSVSTAADEGFSAEERAEIQGKLNGVSDQFVRDTINAVLKAEPKNDTPLSLPSRERLQELARRIHTSAKADGIINDLERHATADANVILLRTSAQMDLSFWRLPLADGTQLVPKENTKPTLLGIAHGFTVCEDDADAPSAIAVGEYSHGKKVGTWRYYDFMGSIETRTYHDDGSVSTNKTDVNNKIVMTKTRPDGKFDMFRMTWECGRSALVRVDETHLDEEALMLNRNLRTSGRWKLDGEERYRVGYWYFKDVGGKALGWCKYDDNGKVISKGGRVDSQHLTNKRKARGNW